MAKPSNHNSQVCDENMSVLLRSGRSGPHVRLTRSLEASQHPPPLVLLYCIIMIYLVLLFNRDKNSKSSPASTASTIVEQSMECPLLGVVWLTETINILGSDLPGQTLLWVSIIKSRVRSDLFHEGHSFCQHASVLLLLLEHK